MNKEDEDFLARVVKHAPEGLNTKLPETAFDTVLKRLIDTAASETI